MANDTGLATFTWNQADAASTTYDVTLGFQPDFVILWTEGQNSTTDQISSALRPFEAMGFGTSDTDRRAMVFTSADAVGTALTACYQTEIGVLVLCSTAGASTGRLDIAAQADWPADGIRFVVDVQSSAGNPNIRVHVLGVGGVTNATTITLSEHNTTGTQNITTVGFQPTGVMFLSVGLNTASETGSGTRGFRMVGAASGGSDEGVLLAGSDDAATLMDTLAYCRSGECIALLPDPFVRDIDGRADLIQFTSNGFDLNWSERASDRTIYALCWAGGDFHVGNFLTQTNTSNFTETGVGFEPGAAMFFSAARAESTAGTATDHHFTSIGAAKSSTDRVCQATMDENLPTQSDIQVGIEYDQIYLNIATTNAMQGVMDLVSFDSDGMTLVMDDADPAQNFVWYMAFGKAAAGGGGPDYFPYGFMLRGVGS